MSESTLSTMPPAVEADLPVHRISLREITETPRFHRLNQLESYYRCTQYKGYRYDWDGNVKGYGEEADIKPGWYVPIKRREPFVRWDLARSIVTRFTSMLFGRDRWPEITIPGDPDAEDYIKALIQATQLQSRMMEARNLGGAEGTACLSFAVIQGNPRVRVHNPKHCTVLEWSDPDTLRAASVLESYSYKRPVFVGNKYVYKDFYYARYWDAQREIVWDPIPVELGNRVGLWSTNVPFKEALHGYGFCPFYWVQNTPNSYDADGESDFEGLTDAMSALDRLLSATTRGTIANVDPTLVVKMDPSMNTGTVEKGIGKAIFSPGGAEYLELRGDSIRSSMELINAVRDSILETAQIVMGDKGRAGAEREVSGEYLKTKNAPMLAKCDMLREQYGNLLKTMLIDMLIVARILQNQKTEETSVDGLTITVSQQKINLPVRVEARKERTLDGQETETIETIERSPGQSTNIVMNWGPYYPYTWEDIQKAAAAATQGLAGGVMSRQTAIKLIQTMTGVDNVEREMEQIDEDAEVATERQQRAFGGDFDTIKASDLPDVPSDESDESEDEEKKEIEP
jgi:hypothetical protein